MSSRVCILTAALCFRNLAHGNSDRAYPADSKMLIALQKSLAPTAVIGSNRRSLPAPGAHKFVKPSMRRWLRRGKVAWQERRHSERHQDQVGRFYKREDH